MARTIVVIGGAGGGPAAAARAREVDEDARIVLVEKKPAVSWVQAGLRHHLENKVRRVAELDEERATFFQERHRVELRTGTEAIRIDPESHRIALKKSSPSQSSQSSSSSSSPPSSSSPASDMRRTSPPGELEAIRYDACIFSGGAEIVRPTIDGLRGPRVCGFRTADDLATIRRVRAEGGTRAVVLGAGPYGVDAADGLKAAGFDVDVIERSNRVLPSLSLLGARSAYQRLRARVRVHLGDEVVAARSANGSALALALKSGKELVADVVVVATGLRPSTDLLEDAGASLNSDGSVRTTPDMQTTLPGVFACGTAVSVVHAVTRTPLWMPQAAIAMRTSQIAGRNAAAPDGKRAALPPLAGSALYTVGDDRFARTGLSETEARAAFGDERVVAITIHGYAGEPWIGGDELCVRLVVDRKGDVVVGGEIWGREGVPRRVDVLSAAVEAGWSPLRLADVDMAYSPTLGPAVDPLHTAARIAALTLEGSARPIAAEALALRVMRGDDMQIVDVSRGEGGDAAWPAGTKRLPLERLRDRLDELRRDRPVVLVSRTGQRAYQGYRILVQRGFSSVEHLDGGWLSYALTRD